MTMSDEQVFAVGDRVRVKAWEVMEEEYDLLPGGCISRPDRPAYFVPEMRELCGLEATLTEVRYYHRTLAPEGDSERRPGYRLSEWSDCKYHIPWDFCDFMLEKVGE